MITDDLTIILRVVGILLIGLGVLPRAWKEAQVGNGIGRLRKMIFAGILCYFLINLIVFCFTLMRIVFLTNDFVPLASFFNGFQSTVMGVILYIIYHSNFGQIKKH